MRPPYITRTFDPADSPVLADIHRRAILAISPRFYSRAELASWAHGLDPARHARMAEEGATYCVAVNSDGEIQGFASSRPDGPDGRVLAIFVDPDAQGQGIGGALLQTVEQDLIALSPRRLIIGASLSAVAFYEAHGYQVTARRLHGTRGGLEIAMRDMEKTL